MTYISFCSGIEAATVAWEPLGWRPVAFSEIDLFPSKLLAAKYPDVPNLGDLTAVDWSQWRGLADVCVGGTPCQDFSIAGLRASLAGDRGNITLEFLRAVNAIRPRFVVWENVPGVLNTGDNAFGTFLGGLVGCDEALVHSGGGWPNAGVVDGTERAAAWRVLDAQYFGLAQRRRRVFVVASAPGERHPAEVLFEWESLRRDSPPSREKGQDVAGSLGGGSGSRGWCDDLDRAGAFVSAPLTIRPYADKASDESRLVAMTLNAKGGTGRNDFESETFITHALSADGFDASEDGTGRGTPLIPVGPVGPLSACGGTARKHGYGSGQQEVEAGHVIPYAIRAGALRENPASGPMGANNPTAVAYNLRGRKDGAMPEVTDVASLRASSGGSSRTYVGVRRLTPLECERLQGFPDGYTALPGAADGPRYKALGNSMAVPVMRWIGQRIAEATE